MYNTKKERDKKEKKKKKNKTKKLGHSLHMSQQLQLLSNILLMSNLRRVLLNTLKPDEFLMSLLSFGHNTGPKWRTECFP